MTINRTIRMIPHRLAGVLAMLLACVMGTAKSEAANPADSKMDWWREARFGLFIHWGLYSVPAGSWKGQPVPGIGEWIMQRAKIPVGEYASLASQFNPTQFDADAWVALAKEAGMKYIVITAKHHDGFAMYHSKASRYNIVDATPFKRDPLKELATACQKGGIRLGFFYSQAQDWHHAGGAAAGGSWDPAQMGDMDEYLRTIAAPQVKELLTNYGPVAELWWDTPFQMTAERAVQLRPLVDLQPEMITNNRLGGGVSGDFETPEQKIPKAGKMTRDWEACMTINDTWGFKANDLSWKPVPVLVRNLIDIASKGGNYLLNVGPTAEGVIPAASVERLRAMGAWLRMNGEAIYGTKGSPFSELSFGRATQKPGKVFLHIFDWPRDGRLKVPLKNKVKKSYLLTAPTAELTTEETEAGLMVQVPPKAPDVIATVLTLEIEGEPEQIVPAEKAVK